MGGATTIASAAKIDSAAKRGKVAKVEALLEKNPALLESRTGKYANEWTNTRDNTPLHIAAVYGRPKVVELLLDKGATVDARNNAMHTPLHFTAR
jgi:ankyrin repeat protein